jgi:hypothetical protein
MLTERKIKQMLTISDDDLNRLRRSFEQVSTVDETQRQRINESLNRLSRNELNSIAAGSINVLSEHARDILQKRIADGRYSGKNWFVR